MFNSKGKKIGFLGTILFHLFLFLICFFSSIGYTSIIIPDGIEIAYLSSNEQIFQDDEIFENQIKHVATKKTDNDEVVEEIITEESDLINLPTNQDSISINELEEMAEAPSISSELELAFKTLNKLNSSNDSIQVSQHNVDTQISIESDSKITNDIQDGYVLSENRFAVRKIKPDYLCKETGRVVVRVWVNRDGLTIKAEAGIRGTTESASCLLKEAKSAALQTTWTPYLNAPEIQIGQITYNFYRN